MGSMTLRAAGLVLPLLPALMAQAPKLTISEPPALTIKRGATAEVKITATLNEGFHANSHTPSDENLIPLKLTWEAGALTAGNITYPKPKMEKYAFSPDPLSVVTGTFDVTTKFTTAPGATLGASVITGKLRYQACSNNACFPPKTVPVNLSVMIQ
jgi:hypothetical protein